MSVNVIDWFLYTFLSESKKKHLSNLLTNKQKSSIKNAISPGQKRKSLREIERLKHKLNSLGFTEKALEELKYICANAEDIFKRKLASWEIATWYANQYTKESALLCLQYLEIAIKKEKDKDLIRRAAILSAESYRLLGELEAAREVLTNVLKKQKHEDLYLALASIETSSSKKLVWINKAFDLYDYSQVKLKQNASPLYDQLSSDSKQTSLSSGPKVTVIVPAYNAEDLIETSINSLRNQTWSNIEILVVDDCSSDATVRIVEEYARLDARISLIKAPTNGGAYASRNLALKQATGEFITINDADDWSHPQKIETQVVHLLKHSDIVGNFSQQARTTNNLTFYRRGKPGIYAFPNMSSFMFRKETVFSKIGYWDSVRFGGDSEYVKRIKKVFGEKSIVSLKTGPLSFQRQSETSLTGHSAFGFPGFFMGARKEYAEAHDYYHEMNGNNLFYDFPLKKRLFPVPEPMKPDRMKNTKHFDVIIASEFRLLGGTNMSNAEEIKAQKKIGLKTGLIQMNRFDINTVGATNLKIRELIDGETVQMIVYGEEVSCDVLIIRHPPVLQEFQRYIPNVKADSIHVIINQPPKRDYGDSGVTLYDFETCATNLYEYFGKNAYWYPIGPKVREVLDEFHKEELVNIKLMPIDWSNIIDVIKWKREKRPQHANRIRIGRHSRDQYVKWPESSQGILQVYSNDFDVKILGGAKSPKKILGEIPPNWTVYEFGEITPQAFLKELDVFVYYTHKDWVEAFGRVIFEAMATGVPVIIPPFYEELFQEAAIYAEPEEVKDKIHLLMNDRELYDDQVEKGLDYLEKHFGYSTHASRLEKFLHGREQ
ncbi:glycosyl transferase family A [Sutcliffiella horikoshii]|uniref:Glycosyl transferase family A n=2 Tax=Sutcliffiella horikoshii TaxID=79883 RepID=A0ABN4ZHX1_9BACI|nr:glycosyl transferase family A [Sutcliffiella horikoshii]